MQVQTTASYAELCRCATEVVAGVVATHPRAVIGLPTGATPLGFYATLVTWVREQRLDLSGVTVFTLDEYLGLGRDHPSSYAAYIHRHLLQHVTVANACWPDGLSQDPEAEALRYEAAIARAGGFDLAVLGVGVNGHIGFNEPGTPFHSVTHVAALAPETQAANRKYFDRGEPMPERAITVGIRTILGARQVLVLASGEKKRPIVERLLEGEISGDVPATALRSHPACRVITDREAAPRLCPTAGKTH